MSTLIDLEYPRQLRDMEARGERDRWGGQHLPLLRGAPLVTTSRMGRWHRPRSGYIYRWRSGGFLTHFNFWCYQTLSLRNGATWGRHSSSNVVSFAATVPGRDLLCGTCEGRAVGAGQPPVGIECISELIYEPHRDDTSQVCA